MLAACPRGGDCDGDHATKVMIIVMVTWAVLMVVFGVGVWILMHKSRHRPNEWPVDRWRRKEEEKGGGKPMREGLGGSVLAMDREAV